MHLAVLSGFAASIAAPWIHRITRNLSGWIISLIPFSIFFYFASFIPGLSRGETFRVAYTWVPSLNVSLSFHIDGLSLLFALLISGIGGLITIYAGGYLEGHEYLGRFYAFILMFMASMLGVVLADNLFTLFIFWELTSLSSFLLIGFENEQESSRSAALQALLVTGIGGLALLAGFVLLNIAGGTSEISQLAALGDQIQGHPYYVGILILILLGAFTKSAQVPFHFWLPSAMVAPTPVSAYLHSATMVKAGIYLLARMTPVLGGTEIWLVLLVATGLVTTIVGAYLALSNTEMKRILAYSTISSLGIMVLLIGLGASGAIKAVIVFILAHALYKGALFMIAGVVYHETNTLDLDNLGGLWRLMPITAIIAGLAALSLSGLGPVLSFIGKELILEALIGSPVYAILLVAAAVLVGAISVALALIIAIWPFFRTSLEYSKHPHDPNLNLLLGPGLLAFSGLLLGLFPFMIADTIVSPAITAILGQPFPVSLALWHGFSVALGLSGISLLSGLILYRQWIIWRKGSSIIGKYMRNGPAWFYEESIIWLNRLALAQTRILQSGHLHHYLYTIIISTILIGFYALVGRTHLLGTVVFNEVRFYEAGLAILILVSALVSITIRSRLAAVAALGVVGFGVALTFVFFGSPDLAMTQLMVETVTVILLVLVLYHLPGFAILSGRRDRIRDAIIASAAGLMMTLFILSTMQVRVDRPISEFFIEQSYRLAHGRNIVNVILVDFRAMDTLGEITVLSLAAVGVFALLKLRIGKKPGVDQ
jgi:multicomponent Na+:H+ antiporter subunit A